MLNLTPRPSISLLPKFSPMKQSGGFSAGSLPPSCVPHSPASEATDYDFAGLSASMVLENHSDSGNEPVIKSEDYSTESESESESEFKSEAKLDECTGQLVEWVLGFTWDTYAYQRHSDDSLPWRLVAVENQKWIRIQSKKCAVYLEPNSQDINLQACAACQMLVNSCKLKHFVDQAAKDSKPHTPLKYLSPAQMCKQYIQLQKKLNEMKLKVSQPTLTS